MQKILKAIILQYNQETRVTVQSDDVCPICKANLSLNPIHSVVHQTKHYENTLSVFCRCSSCGETYINTYIEPLNHNGYKKIASEPNRFETTVFEENLTTLSPSFVEIYNQAKQAECMSLDQIAGIGYRKAVEFLIKDFAISKHPNDTETIKAMPLSRCINDYIDDIKIKSLAIKTVWLGNDETHYVRKHTDRDINDLKRFINAVVYFIGIDFISQDAETISAN